MAETNATTNLAAQVAQATDIRDIAAPVEIPNYWPWLLGFLALAVIAALALWLWRRAQQQQPAQPTVPPVPPHLLAHQGLEEALTLIQQPKLFVIAVSDTLRTYLEGAFELRAPEQTTEEFLIELRSSSLLNDPQKNRLETFLESCDLVKFARYEPRESELRELHEAALALVNETEPTTDVPDDPSGNEAESGDTES